MLVRGSLRSPIAKERAVTKNGHEVRVGRRSRRGTLVREHRCPPARFWFARPSKSTPLPSGFTNACPSWKSGNAPASGMNYRTGKEKVDQDARGPGWNPLPQFPGRARASSRGHGARRISLVMVGNQKPRGTGSAGRATVHVARLTPYRSPATVRTIFWSRSIVISPRFPALSDIARDP